MCRVLHAALKTRFSMNAVFLPVLRAVRVRRCVLLLFVDGVVVAVQVVLQLVQPFHSSGLSSRPTQAP